MLYNLPNGKVIEISVEQYLDMTDEEFEYLLSINFGENIENPFFGSILQKSVNPLIDVEEEAPTPVDKVIEPDIDFTPEEE
jgi:hypothetical protein